MHAGEYYLHACLDRIREDSGLFATSAQAENNVRLMPDSRPPAGAGILFIGLTETNARPRNNPIDRLWEEVNIAVHITLRTTTAPPLRVGSTFQVRADQREQFPQSLKALARRIVTLLDRNDNVMGRAQTKLAAAEGLQAYPLTGPLRLFSASEKPQLVGRDHFQELRSASEDIPIHEEAGLLYTITFHGGERLS